MNGDICEFEGGLPNDGGRERCELGTVEVIVEWENAKLSELDRAQEMLAQLVQQASDPVLKDKYEISAAIYYDQDEIDPDLIEGMIEKAYEGVRSNNQMQFRVVGCEGKEYYALKNFGAQQSQADFVLFLDSDVIPEERWLPKLLGPLDNPEVPVVCGSVVMDTSSVYARAFSLFWFYDPEPKEDALVLTRRFPANSTVFERELFLAHQFPETDLFKGQCAMLADKLLEAGVKIHRQPGARVVHPAPNGLGHFVGRALLQGHDYVVGKRRKKGWLRTTPVHALLRFVKSEIGTFVSLLSSRKRRASGISAIEAPATFAIASAYHLLRMFGEVFAFVAPKTLRRIVAID